MLAQIIDFVNLLLAALLTGSMFGAWLILNPTRLDATSYVAVQQQGIRTLNTILPALGAATILVTIAAAAHAREDGARLWVLMAAVLCFVTSGLITRFRNQPINAIVMNWRVDMLPSNWTALRDDWRRWHLVRLASGVAGLSLLIAAALRRA